MSLTRREFIKLCMSSAVGASLLTIVGPDLERTLALAADGKPPVIWLQGASCTGCSVSLLNSVDPAIEKVLLDIISLKYHPNISAGSGHLIAEILDEAATKYKDQFILVVEGAIPLNNDGVYCTIAEKDGREITMLHAVNVLGKAAKAVIAAGQCASYGGIPGAAPNPTGVVGVNKIVDEKKVINISLCPMQPDHFLGTVVYILTYGQIPELDRYGRPKMFFPKPIHESCLRREHFDAGRFARFIGDEGCLALLGCKGFVAMSDCPTRGWNNNVNWCVKAGAPCYACSEPTFPDMSSPIYGVYPLTNKTAAAAAYLNPQKTEFLEKNRASRKLAE
ncbi:Periplasmic (NiFeSe) hydrogenase small subunit precursor [Pelotomaculum sp. FP]|uniref:hydrogenase small subunit n=1 Tax=Pelotomaculum sp. FP TaxID=261474 RepID=UPI0010657E5B|nr:hydrogenase small subunit [Pelotomaculum sp. FP]TEB12702.1 Periplasmic (NiFeSe) hydrogenase small subunit precursor [Pelotomaculum sp. FP]